MAKYAHKLVAKTAQEIAAYAYQDMAMDDMFYKMWPNERNFVKKQWGTFVRPASEALARMLAMDKYSEKVKEEIMQALLFDRALPERGDTSVQESTASIVH